MIERAISKNENERNLPGRNRREREALVDA